MPRFQKGAPSPNPNGRPPGAKSATNLLRSEMVSDADLKTIVDKVVAMAKAGDLAAAALVLNRTIPVLKPRVGDIEEEVGRAEAIQAARLRAASSSPFRIGVLEALVTQSLAPDLLIATGVCGGLVGGSDAPAPNVSDPAPAIVAEPLAPPPRLDMRDDNEPDGNYVTGDYVPNF